MIDTFVRRAYLMREWIGPEVKLVFDLHGKMTPALAIEICRELQGMRPLFVEEPVPQENVAALRQVDEREAEQNRAYEEELGGEFYHPADGSVADW